MDSSGGEGRGGVSGSGSGFDVEGRDRRRGVIRGSVEDKSGGADIPAAAVDILLDFEGIRLLLRRNVEGALGGCLRELSPPPRTDQW